MNQNHISCYSFSLFILSIKISTYQIFIYCKRQEILISQKNDRNLLTFYDLKYGKNICCIKKNENILWHIFNNIYSFAFISTKLDLT